MNILVVNDDGINAKGLWMLHDSLIEKGHNVWVVAPSTEKSAQSHAITIRDPLRVERYSERAWSVTGTPVDCVIVAFEGLLKEEGRDQTPDPKPQTPHIDLVISGINAGPNRGDDVLYSGTVAAAIEAMCFGVRAIALSITSHTNQKYETAIHCFMKLLEKGIHEFIGHREILNINVPNVEINEVQGYIICQTGFRRYQEMLGTQSDPRNRTMYWILGRDPIYEIGKYDIDYHVTIENKVAISPLKIDFNNYEKIKTMRKWLEDLEF